jgi:vacuolar-type H+-ATPase subunit I/STV1
VSVDFDYTLSDGGLSKVVARSSIDEQLGRALKDRFADIATQYESRLREELSAHIEAQLEENETLYGAFGELEQTAGGNLSDVQAYEAVLEQKRSAVEKRIADVEKQATDAVKSELEKQLDQIKDKVPLPRLDF